MFSTLLSLIFFPCIAADEQNEHCIGHPLVVIIVVIWVSMSNKRYFFIGNKFSAGKGSSSRSCINGASGFTTISFEFLSSNTIPLTSCRLL